LKWRPPDSAKRCMNGKEWRLTLTAKTSRKDSHTRFRFVSSESCKKPSRMRSSIAVHDTSTCRSAVD
jgi:hypothetical protein